MSHGLKIRHMYGYGICGLCTSCTRTLGVYVLCMQGMVFIGRSFHGLDRVERGLVTSSVPYPSESGRSSVFDLQSVTKLLTVE